MKSNVACLKQRKCELWARQARSIFRNKSTQTCIESRPRRDERGELTGLSSKQESPMRKTIMPVLLAGSAALAGCTTYDEPMATAATAERAAACGTYGYIDRDNDGYVEADEWTTYRTSAYASWDANGNGQID